MHFDLFAMSNLRSKSTGVPGTVIWVSAGEPSGDGCLLGPRLWVVLGDSLSPEPLKDAVVVRLTSPPQVLGTLPSGISDQVVSFIDRNGVVLLAYWHAEISTREMLDLLEPVCT
jgi:hypothetical protein